MMAITPKSSTRVNAAGRSDSMPRGLFDAEHTLGPMIDGTMLQIGVERNEKTQALCWAYSLRARASRMFRSLWKDCNHPICGGAGALASFALPYRSRGQCAVGPARPRSGCARNPERACFQQTPGSSARAVQGVIKPELRNWKARSAAISCPAKAFVKARRIVRRYASLLLKPFPGNILQHLAPSNFGIRVKSG
jgi:hypothetical protein